MINEPYTTIFYLDDDLDDLDIFIDAVAVLGKNVHVFQLADEFIATLHNPPPAPSIVFLDLNMPVRNGFDILSEVRASEAFKDLPIVVYSTAADAQTIDRCFSLGATYYAKKPTSIAALMRLLKHILAIDWQSFEPSRQNFVYTAS